MRVPRMAFAVWWACALGAGAAHLAFAQQPVARATGAVAGHVYCVDTNLPARIAMVALQTIDVKPDPPPGAKFEPGAPLRTYQTSLDGSFTIPKVKPGTYYVVIQKAGYLSPITQFTRAELAQPTPEILARIMKVVPVVTVEASHTTALEVRLDRGAALTGTILYDDGTPVAASSVSVLTREIKDKKETWASNYPRTYTDDQGHYRITGLPAGEYLPRVNLELDDRFTSSILGLSGSSSTNTKYSLYFFAGDTVRQSASKPVKLEAGEQRAGADITIPLSKLHSVTGTITERSGRAVNAGKLALTYDDGTQLVSTKVDKEDGLFHFDFVPEGTYTLAVTEAKDVVREEIPNPLGTYPPSETKETTVKEYGRQSQPLMVQSDVSGLVVSVPEKKASVP